VCRFLLNRLFPDKKRVIAADRSLLELIQLALKADQQERALQLCALFQGEKSLNLAIQLARHSRLLTLADRMEKVRGAEECQPVEMEMAKPVLSPKKSDDHAIKTLSDFDNLAASISSQKENHLDVVMDGETQMPSLPPPASKSKGEATQVEGNYLTAMSKLLKKPNQ
jgi:hypothetical protein